MIKASIYKPITMLMVILTVVVFGLYTYSMMVVDLMPKFEVPVVTATMVYAGANPEEIETTVIKPVEEQVELVDGIDYVQSICLENYGIIVAMFNMGVNVDVAANDVRSKVELASANFPDAVEAPIISKVDINGAAIMAVSFTGPLNSTELLQMVEDEIEPLFTSVSGVASVDVFGGTTRQISIELDKDKMKDRGVDIATIMGMYGQSNLNYPVGEVIGKHKNTSVRTAGKFQNLDEMRNMDVPTANGVIKLSEIAKVKDTIETVTSISRFNGTSSVTLDIKKRSDANVVDVSKGVIKRMNAINKSLPEGFELHLVYDKSEAVNEAIDNVIQNVIIAIFLTAGLLLLFLGKFSTMFIAALTMPTSVIGAFTLMYFAGFGINMMSLMGMTLCIGILVDDSIVVLENIVRHLQMGEQPEVAAEKGRNEIGMAAIAITLCDAVTFLPIAFMSGMTGQFFRQFGLTIVFAGMFSLFVSFTLTPMLASQLFKKGWQVPKHRLWDFMDNVERWAVVHYERLLRKSFHQQKAVLLSGLGLFAGVLLLVPTGVIGTEYMPRSDEGSFQIMVELPVSRTVEETDKVLKVLEAKLDTVPEVEYYLTRGGGSNAYEGRIKVQLSKRSERSRSIWDVTNELRQFVKNNDFNGANIRIMETQTSVAGVSGGGGPGNGGALRIELRGSDNEKLIAESNRIMEMLKEKGNGISDVSSTYTEGLPELQMSVDREKLRALGVSLGNIDSAMSSVISGRSAGTLVNDPLNENQDTDIKVRFKGADGYKVSDISAIPVSTGDRTVFLGDVADIKYGTGPVTIRRVDKQRAISISANIGARPLNEVIQEVEADLQGMQLDETVSYRFKGQAANMNDTYQQLVMALLMAMVLIYMLLAVLYESVLTPFIRMFSLPLGLIGSLLLLLFTGNTLNLYSMIGILVMDGVVAKNGTLLLDYTMTLQERGYSAWNAIIEAGKVRLKPIFMTTITMIVGMLPTALAITEGAETRVSMAWVIIGGLITSTIFTLIVIPIIFMFFENYPPRTWGDLLRHKYFPKTNIS